MHEFGGDRDFVVEFPALGRGDRLWGYRYHQLFSISSGESLGGVYAFGFRKRDPYPCWEPNGRAILYADYFFSDITVVRVESSGGN